MEGVNDESDSIDFLELPEVPWDDLRRFQYQDISLQDLLSFLQWSETVCQVFQSCPKQRIQDPESGDLWEALELPTEVSLENASYETHSQIASQRLSEWMDIVGNHFAWDLMFRIGNRFGSQDVLQVIVSNELSEVPSSWTQLHQQFHSVWRHVLLRLESSATV
jgi:hypothetical protein